MTKDTKDVAIITGGLTGIGLECAKALKKIQQIALIIRNC